MEKYMVRDVVLIIVLLALGLFFAGLAGYFMDRSPGHSAFSLMSLIASVISIVSALLIVLKFLLVTPIIEEIRTDIGSLSRQTSEEFERLSKQMSEDSRRTNRVILASSAAASTKTLEEYIEDFNRVKGMEV